MKKALFQMVSAVFCLVFVFQVTVLNAADDKKAAKKSDVIASFEEESDIDSWALEGGAEGEMSDKHATEGKKSLKITIPENTGENYPGILADDTKFSSLFPADWSTYDEFAIDIFNESEAPVMLNWKFKSGTTGKLTKEINIPKGKAFVMKIKIKDLKGLEATDMNYMKIFGSNLPIKVTLYLDNVRLTKK
ncbi:MAG: hypothetical protein A2044_04895 [Candidatus Firestonebacteria bacterium GWA2_43_8]|nr:MAG: hypothetical protein A2044_04895 [Candidatus Firestonebacteria bacterium GWA2_43_8]